MATTNSAIPDITVGEETKEATANTAHNHLDNLIQGSFNFQLAADADEAMSNHADGTSNARRYLVFDITNAVTLTATRVITVPAVKQLYVVQNNTTGGQSISWTPSGGTGITVANGDEAFAWCDGTNMQLMPPGSLPTLLANKELQGTIETVQTVSSSSGTLTLDCNYNVWECTLTENITSVVFSNAPASGKAFAGTLKIIQAAGSYTVTWGGVARWPGGTAPTMTAANGAVDVFTVFFLLAGATDTYWFTAGQDLK
jgi:hypothetical protein